MKYKLEMYLSHEIVDSWIYLREENSDSWEHAGTKIFDYADEDKAKAELLLLYMANSDLKKRKILFIYPQSEENGDLRFQLGYKWDDRPYSATLSIFFKFRKTDMLFDETDTFKDLLTHENEIIRKFAKGALGESNFR